MVTVYYFIVVNDDNGHGYVCLKLLFVSRFKDFECKGSFYEKFKNSSVLNERD
jgi:hypothetical protein